MITAVVFAGQGDERPGMGLDLAAASRRAADLLGHASELTGVDLFRELDRCGPALRRTDVVQAAMAAVGLGVFLELRDAGARPDLVAGHSSGEIAALAAAGWVPADRAVELAGLRGSLMAREARTRPGGMLAVFLDTEEAVAEAVEHGRRRGRLDIAAHNGPGEWVLTGDDDALRLVASEVPSKRLSVSGSWHGPAMAGAVDELRDALSSRMIEPEPGSPHLVGNRAGEVIGIGVDLAGEIAGQLARPVCLIQVFETFSRLGVTDVVVAGPGRALRGLIRRNMGQRVAVHGTDDIADLRAVIEVLGQ